MPTSEILHVSNAGRRVCQGAPNYGGVDYVELAVDTETAGVHIEKVSAP